MIESPLIQELFQEQFTDRTRETLIDVLVGSCVSPISWCTL